MNPNDNTLTGYWLWQVLLLTLWVFAIRAEAQPPTPGAVQSTLPEKPKLEAPKEAPPPEVTAPRAPRPEVPAGGKTLVVQRFEFSGNTAISSEDLAREIEPFIGADLTLADLYTVADILTDYYRAKGYSLAQVVVPAQRVQQGIVRLDVIEGEINAVLFEGNDSYTNEFLAPFFSRIRPGAVVSLQSLERELLIVNDLPGFTSRAVVQPGPKYGTTDLVIRGKEDRLEGRVSVNNYGRQDLGEWRMEGEVTFNNPLRHGDRLNLIGIHSEANLLNYASADYSIALNGKGTRAAATFSFFDYNVGEDFAVLDIEGQNYYSHLLVSHPIERSRKRNVLFGVGFGLNNSKEKVLGDKTKDNDLYAMDLNLLVNWLHRRSAFSTARVTVSSNFQSNTDGKDNEKLEGKLELEVDHLRAFAPNWFFYARGLMVYSADPLPDTEKLDLGGVVNNRGFAPSELRGDKGGLLTFELRRQFRLPHRFNATAKAFWDLGEANKIKPSPGEESYESLTSVGLGLTVSYADQYIVEIAAAKPTNDRDVSDSRDDGRAWVNISAYF